MNPGTHKPENIDNMFHQTLGRGYKGYLRLIKQIPNIKHELNYFKTMVKRHLLLEEPAEASFYPTLQMGKGQEWSCHQGKSRLKIVCLPILLASSMKYILQSISKIDIGNA